MSVIAQSLLDNLAALALSDADSAAFGTACDRIAAGDFYARSDGSGLVLPPAPCSLFDVAPFVSSGGPPTLAQILLLAGILGNHISKRDIAIGSAVAPVWPTDPNAPPTDSQRRAQVLSDAQGVTPVFTVAQAAVRAGLPIPSGTLEADRAQLLSGQPSSLPYSSGDGS